MSASGKRTRDRIELCVGGTRITTTVSTLAGGSSFFSRKFSHEWDQSESELFLDRDAEPFTILLSCMRSMSASLLPSDDERMFKRVLLEAEYFQCDWLLHKVKVQAMQNICKTKPFFSRPKNAEEYLQKFQEQWATVDDALTAGVLPARYFAEPKPPPRPEVLSVMPAPEKARVVFMNERGVAKERVRPVAYAMVKYAARQEGGSSWLRPREIPAGTHLEPLVSAEGREGHGNFRPGQEFCWDEECGPTQSIYLASEYAAHRIDLCDDAYPCTASWKIVNVDDDLDSEPASPVDH